MAGRQRPAGKELELGEGLAIGYSFHIAETEQQAIKEATPFFEENMKMFAPLGFVRGLSSEQIAAIADPRRARSAGLPTLDQAAAAGSWLCGPAELITEKLMNVQDRYPGLESVNVGTGHWHPPVGHPGATPAFLRRGNAGLQEPGGPAGVRRLSTAVTTCPAWT